MPWYDAEVEQVGEDVEDKNGALVLGSKSWWKAIGAADGVGDFSWSPSYSDGDGIEIVSVSKVAHGAETGCRPCRFNVVVAI